MAAPQPLRDVSVLIPATGMRPSEIYNLKRENFSPDKEVLQIENGKTKASNRRVWLSEKAADILRRRLETLKGDFVFSIEDADGKLPKHVLGFQHPATLKRAGLKFRIYDCRHSFATRQAEKGVNLLTLAAMLGHFGLNQVQRHAHPSEDQKRDAMQQKQNGKAKAV